MHFLTDSRHNDELREFGDRLYIKLMDQIAVMAFHGTFVDAN